ncbi:MAG: SHOCT domain-containing protein [bacterium]|nr:SHOCT domain-containing protein [bacterium]
MILFGYIIFAIVRGCIWGIATNAVIANKKYDENWFWWGFFFGIIALIVAATKPQNVNTYASQYYGIGTTREEIRQRDIINNDGWKCKRCGTVNPNYTGSCGCGMTKQENERYGQEVSRQETSVEVNTKTLDKFEQVKKYKELLDSGILTQEEFDIKKKELLSL